MHLLTRSISIHRSTLSVTMELSELAIRVQSVGRWATYLMSILPRYILLPSLSLGSAVAGSILSRLAAIVSP